VLNDYQLHVLIVGFYYSMLVLAWGFLAGKAGVFSLGIHALAGLAAYTSALAVTYYRLPFIITMPLGVLVAVAISFSLAALTLKMKGIYLALTTWAFAEISRLLISALYEITRGDLPSVGLSPLIAGEVYKSIYRLNLEHGITVLVVDQNVKKAVEISNYVYYMEAGEIRYYGPLSEALDMMDKIVEASLMGDLIKFQPF